MPTLAVTTTSRPFRLERAAELLSDTLRHQKRVDLLGQLVEQDDELVTAKAGHGVFDPDAGL